jgi:hypothetical protein
VRKRRGRDVGRNGVRTVRHPAATNNCAHYLPHRVTHGRTDGADHHPYDEAFFSTNFPAVKTAFGAAFFSAKSSTRVAAILAAEHFALVAAFRAAQLTASE